MLMIMHRALCNIKTQHQGSIKFVYTCQAYSINWIQYSVDISKFVKPKTMKDVNKRWDIWATAYWFWGYFILRTDRGELHCALTEADWILRKLHVVGKIITKNDNRTLLRVESTVCKDNATTVDNFASTRHFYYSTVRDGTRRSQDKITWQYYVCPHLLHQKGTGRGFFD